MSRRVGAPKGGRVHWLLWNLRGDFKRAYRCVYNYAKHSYVFYRFRGKCLRDVFLVVQTSRHCWRCMYFDSVMLEFQYFSCFASCHLALRMWFIYRKSVERVEE